MIRVSIDGGRTWAPVQEIYVEHLLPEQHSVCVKLDSTGMSIDYRCETADEALGEDSFTWSQVVDHVRHS